MIPSDILNALLIPLAEIRASAPDAIKLASLYNAARGGIGASPRGIYSRFIGAMTAGGYSVEKARGAYKQAKFWGTYDAMLMNWPSYLELDERLAGQAKTPSAHAQDFGQYRMHVSATVTDRTSGASRRYGFYIQDTRPPTPESLRQQAQIALEAVIGTSPTVGGRRDLEGLDVNYDIDEFVQLV